ncbi:hypothetical protein J2S00_003918 [Caldalkalibacillus uzonensis]|uniref:Spore coat protein n=1 Tax=Caldalkalibacillus uzonensis TaxID=353224 RepID=A0ABU0CY45_9BACI|nr:hypothetical protein [Caldalkalibacillus uzonensis]
MRDILDAAPKALQTDLTEHIRAILHMQAEYAMAVKGT